MRNPNSYGSISKLSGKRRKPYMVRKTIGFDENGHQICKILGYFEKRKDALEYLVSYNQKLGVINYDIPLVEVYNASMAKKYTEQDKCIPPVYKTPYNALEPLWRTPFAKIRLVDYEQILKTLSSNPIKKNYKILLGMMYKYAVKHCIVEKNLAEMLEIPSLEKSEKHQPFTEEEMSILWQNSSDLGAKIWLIYCYTGLRPTELILIKTEDCHLDKKYLIGGIKTESGKNRIVPIADCILPFIEEMYEPNKEYLLNNRQGNPYTYKNIKQIMVKYCDKLGIHHIPHDARHTCATMLEGAEVTLPTIKNILGHAGESVTDRVYIHKQLPVMLKAVNKLPIFI